MLAAALAAASCASDERAQAIDLSTRPSVIFMTDPFGAGERYTFGYSADQWIEQDDGFIIESIDLVMADSVAVVGIGAYDATTVDINVSLVPDWPPERFPLAAQGEAVFGPTWPAMVVMTLGIEVADDIAGFRGISASWFDASGDAHTSVTDVAVVTCSRPTCSDASVDQLLVELRLWCPADACR